MEQWPDNNDEIMILVMYEFEKEYDIIYYYLSLQGCDPYFLLHSILTVLTDTIQPDAIVSQDQLGYQWR